MKASILIPAFNAADCIEETLQSCLDQGEECVEEIIVVDDHSTDATCAVVRAIQERTSSIPIQLVLNPKKGACSARNHALSLAQGEAIQWLDADDLLGPGKLQSQLVLLQGHPEHLLASKWQWFTGSLDNPWPDKQGSWAKVPQ